ncbi:MAG: bifunctional 4-hydroxy-2-oxoglutarate aldolase/2-dehydro-3-deoxy-phosphogluconate aldolase [Thermoguttaceae bacterium]|nr:bifunctional 4-hydroxy-2-oxoglutarate aldolase/2-dehydro-3-deoxy-phosphogluconate aldolase [Thermoguttaceae bacterium]
MNRFFNQELTERLRRSGVMAVLVIEEPRHAVPTAQALLRGGIDVMELALRTPKSLEALRRILSEVPQMTAGVGTILSPEQVKTAQELGAAFGVAPGFSRDVVTEALNRQFPFAPGILTPSELESAISFGCRTVKLFPAQISGGPDYIKAIHAPYRHLGIQFIPLGGLSLTNMAEYLRYNFIPAVGGSWISPSEVIRSENWDLITDRAAQAVSIVRKVRDDLTKNSAAAGLPQK